MSDQQKISMGLVRKGYALNGNDVEKAVQALWPNAIFPVELWRRAYETFWRAFADANQATYKIESPALPEIDMTSRHFHTHLCAIDVMTFFRKLSLNIPASDLREGLKYILEESYEDIDAVFPEERDFLFSALLRLEKVDIFDQYSPDSELFEEKILSVPISSYHFIAQIFANTVLVDTVAVIRHFHNYPLRQEVKGLTHRLVKSVLDSQHTATPANLESTEPTAEPAALQPQGQKALSLPRSLWNGKSKEFICAALREKGWGDLEIAHVLFHKRGFKGKRAIGRLLHENANLTDFAYDKNGSQLFEKSKTITILDEEDT